MKSFFRGLWSVCLVAVLASGIERTSADDARTLPIGWRTDARGAYPDATPPTHWSTTENVVWKTPMPGRSFGSPIVVGDRLFVVSDPAELLCLNAQNGEIVWRRTNSAVEVIGQERTDQMLAEWKALSERKQQLQKQFGELRKSQPDDKEAQDLLKTQLEQLEKQLTAVRRGNPISADRGSGNTAATPVSDGRHVYAAFGSGIVAAYTLAGEPRWIKFVEGTEINFGHASSPVLIGGKVIVHYHDLVALDAATGDVAWRTELPAKHATSVAIHLGGVEAIVSPAGNVVRVSDGKSLLAEPALRVQEGSAITQGDIVYSQGDKTSAFRLPASDAAAKLELLWQAATSRGRRTPSPVLHDGLLYGCTTEGILDVTDAADGTIVYRKRLDLGDSLYSSVTAAGNLLFVSNTKGTTLVFQPGRKFEEIARNELEPLGSNPIFVGRRVYLRGHKNMYCIGDL